MTSAAVLQELHAALAPEALRGAVLRFAQWREMFTPATFQPASREELLWEVVRFVAHMHQHYYATPAMSWPEAIARRETDALLLRHCGSSWEGERILWRLASEHSLRAVLDWLTRRMQEDALHTYLDLRVLTPLKRLSLDDQLALAHAYVEMFCALPLETEHPALVMSRWHEVLGKHARIVLGWA